MDYKVVIYYDDEDEIYWGHPEDLPGLLVEGPTFLEVVRDLEILIDSYEKTVEGDHSNAYN